VALAHFDRLGIDDLPERIRNNTGPRSGPVRIQEGDSNIVPLEEVERRHITQVLHAMGGNKASAARALGLDRRTLYRKLRRWRAGSPDTSTR
jgi:two-component system response regulator HydG